MLGTLDAHLSHRHRATRLGSLTLPHPTHVFTTLCLIEEACDELHGDTDETTEANAFYSWERGTNTLILSKPSVRDSRLSGGEGAGMSSWKQKRRVPFSSMVVVPSISSPYRSGDAMLYRRAFLPILQKLHSSSGPSVLCVLHTMIPDSTGDAQPPRAGTREYLELLLGTLLPSLFCELLECEASSDPHLRYTVQKPDVEVQLQAVALWAGDGEHPPHALDTLLDDTTCGDADSRLSGSLGSSLNYMVGRESSEEEASLRGLHYAEWDVQGATSHTYTITRVQQVCARTVEEVLAIMAFSQDRIHAQNAIYPASASGGSSATNTRPSLVVYSGVVQMTEVYEDACENHVTLKREQQITIALEIDSSSSHPLTHPLLHSLHEKAGTQGHHIHEVYLLPVSISDACLDAFERAYHRSIYPKLLAVQEEEAAELDGSHASVRRLPPPPLPPAAYHHTTHKRKILVRMAQVKAEHHAALDEEKARGGEAASTTAWSHRERILNELQGELDELTLHACGPSMTRMDDDAIEHEDDVDVDVVRNEGRDAWRPNRAREQQGLLPRLVPAHELMRTLTPAYPDAWSAPCPSHSIVEEDHEVLAQLQRDVTAMRQQLALLESQQEKLEETLARRSRASVGPRASSGCVSTTWAESDAVLVRTFQHKLLQYELDSLSLWHLCVVMRRILQSVVAPKHPIEVQLENTAVRGCIYDLLRGEVSPYTSASVSSTSYPEAEHYASELIRIGFTSLTALAYITPSDLSAVRIQGNHRRRILEGAANLRRILTEEILLPRHTTDASRYARVEGCAITQISTVPSVDAEWEQPTVERGVRRGATTRWVAPWVQHSILRTPCLPPNVISALQQLTRFQEWVEDFLVLVRNPSTDLAPHFLSMQ